MFSVTYEAINTWTWGFKYHRLKCCVVVMVMYTAKVPNSIFGCTSRRILNFQNGCQFKLDMCLNLDNITKVTTHTRG